MPMSFDGHAANSSGWFIRPRVRETGSTGCAERHRNSLPTGHYVMATAEHREPCESRGSRTVLGAPEGESPSGDSTIATGRGKLQVQPRPQCPVSDARPTQCNKSRWAMKRPGLVRALSPTRHEPDAREAETPRQNYFSFSAKNA